MSSSFVRSSFTTFLSSNIGSETLIDFSGEFREIKELLSDNSISPDEVFTAIEFMPGSETPITVGSTNTSGKYRENGLVFVQVVGLAKLGSGGGAATLARAEALRDKFRGIRLGTGNKISVESMTVPSFNDSGAIHFGQGYSSVSFFVEYMFDKDL